MKLNPIKDAKTGPTDATNDHQQSSTLVFDSQELLLDMPIESSDLTLPALNVNQSPTTMLS